MDAGIDGFSEFVLLKLDAGLILLSSIANCALCC